MSLNYHGNQFEAAYRPTALRNWEVPKQFTHEPKRPKQREGATEIASNNRGHILPGYPKSEANPWGNFVGTWHLPRRIDREMADRLNGTKKRISCEEKRRMQQEELCKRICGEKRKTKRQKRQCRECKARLAANEEKTEEVKITVTEETCEERRRRLLLEQCKLCNTIYQIHPDGAIDSKESEEIGIQEHNENDKEIEVAQEPRFCPIHGYID